jgi:hypothetical protein
MRKLLLLTLLLNVLSIKSYSQIAFERGYFIDESNQKIDCYIKNIGWKNNPTEFEYKLPQNEAVQIATIQTVKEFGIYEVSRYIRARVKMDRSDDKVDNLNYDRNPTFHEEQLFLKVLIEGEATLFSYADGDLTRFFYALNDSEINQLVYKRYLVDNQNNHNSFQFSKQIFQNTLFRQQLFLDLKCHGITSNDVSNIKYNSREIKRIFVRYNECTHSAYYNYDQSQKKDILNISIRPGLHYSSLAIHNSLYDSHNTDFGSKMGFSFGIETEYILPYNKNKWGITVEPTLQYYKSERTKEVHNVSGGILVSEVNYKSIELPVGIRHYFFLNDNSKLFINFSYIWDFTKNSTVEFTRSDGSKLNSLDIKPNGNISFGSGLKHRDIYSIEMRYQTNRDILGKYTFWFSDYKTFSVIFGYTLF